MPSRLSKRQKTALKWIADYSTLPPIEPSTWKSLLRRGLFTLHFDGAATITEDSKSALNG